MNFSNYKLLFLAITALLCVFSCACSTKKTVWSDESGLVPDRFMYLYFPVNNNVELLKNKDERFVPSGKLLNRAFLCSEQEFKENNYIVIYVDNEQFYVAKDKITVYLQTNEANGFVEEYNRTLRKLGDKTDTGRVRVSFFEDGSKHTVVLSVIDRKNRQENYFYSTKDGKVFPVRIESERSLFF